MQATTVEPATAPAPTVAPPPLTITFTDVDGTAHTLTVPMSRQAIADVRERRSELSDQLTSASGRRHRLSEEIKSAPDGASRTGLEQRLGVLDKRIVQLESDIASTGRQLSAAPQSIVGDDWRPPGNPGDIPDNVAAIAGTTIVLIGFPIAIAIARNLWKRGTRSAVAALSPVSEQRLERLEQGVDAIAIEIERVAEGQRFVTRLLSEGQAAIRLPHGEEVREKATT